MIFFTLELNRLEDAVLEAKLKDPALAHWQPWLRDLRVFRPHQLSDELEKLLHEKEVTGRSAWSRLFDETIAGMRVPVNGEELTVTDALNKLSDRDRSVREAAGRAIGETFGKNIKLFSLITNTLAKDKEIIDQWRHYPRPASHRNLSNMVEDEVVDALVSRGAAGLSPPVAPLLHAESEMARSVKNCSTGTAMRRCQRTMIGSSLGTMREAVCSHAYACFQSRTR